MPSASTGSLLGGAAIAAWSQSRPIFPNTPIVAYLAALEAGHAVALCGTASMARMRRLQAGILLPPLSAVAGAWSGWREMRSHRIRTCLLLSTSGSTGQGKWVRLSHMNNPVQCAVNRGISRFDAADRGCLILPLHYSYGLFRPYAHLAVGAKRLHAGLFHPRRGLPR
ncbi:AMP-binding protein [Sinorhizobium meliloti]|nr:AMP-binding protein [Sinorhizobium meliloti]